MSLRRSPYHIGLFEKKTVLSLLETNMPWLEREDGPLGFLRSGSRIVQARLMSLNGEFDY
jgi:hypothetical protein